MTDILRKILYVEDEPDIQAVAKIALEVVGGYELKVCSSGREALDCVQAFAPDLLLLDVMMPELDGPSTLAALKQTPGIETVPAMFMTAKVQPDEVAELKAQGACEVIAKPFDPMNLAATIAQAWADREK